MSSTIIDNSVAAVVVFKCGNDVERVQKFLDEMAKRGIIQPAKAEPFDSFIETPVLYFP